MGKSSAFSDKNNAAEQDDTAKVDVAFNRDGQTLAIAAIVAVPIPVAVSISIVVSIAISAAAGRKITIGTIALCTRLHPGADRRQDQEAEQEGEKFFH